MRDSDHRPGPESAAGQSGPGPQNGPDAIDRAFAAVESAFAEVLARVERLESDLRNLQSQSANRS